MAETTLIAIIYKITNKLNGKIYIGKTISTLGTRWSQHCHEAGLPFPGCRYLNAAIRKYGSDGFLVEILLIVDEIDLDYYEKRSISFYSSSDRRLGYNLTHGGDGGRPTKEARKHMSLAQKGNKNCVGRKLSEETRKRISEATKGRKPSAEQILAFTKRMKGRSVSAETRRKQSQSLTGRVFSEEHRKNIGLATRRRHASNLV